MKVYDPEGKQHDRDSVDVRELCAQGWTTTPPSGEVVELTDAEKKAIEAVAPKGGKK